MEAPSLARVDTQYSADSIEFCPVPGYERWFTCGTYQLLKPGTDELAPAPGSAVSTEPAEQAATSESTAATSRGNADAADDTDSDADDADPSTPEPTPEAPRIGRLYLFGLDGTAPTEAWRGETPAILDAKWARAAGADGAPEVAVADAKGGLARYSLHTLNNDGGTAAASLDLTERLAVTDESTLVLSLDWGYGVRAREIMTSLSSGALAHVVPRSSGMAVATQWDAHDFEPWICAWDGESPDVVWSGGDDLALKRWDVRAPAMPNFTWRRADGGITTIAPSPHQPHLLAVGSYDAHLRIFDTRAPRTPLTEVEMPGGIWRTRWHPSPSRKGDILNACMHGGFAVARLDDTATAAEITTTFPGTLAYGADWCRRDDGATSVVATFSFYDHVMDVWRA